MNNNLSQSSLNDVQINTIKSEIDNTLNSAVQLSDDEKIKKNEDIKEMIRYYGGMTKNIEDRRIRIADNAWQSLAISITALGVIVSLPIISIIKIPILIVLGMVFIVSLVKIREFQQQSNFRYPFIEFPEYGNKWKWFYYGNSFIPKMNSNPFTFNKSRSQDEILYLKGLNLFVNNYTSETINEELRNNLIQLFLLQVHNYYKNHFYLRLLNYDLKTPSIILFLIALYLVIVTIILIAYPDIAIFLVTKTF